MKNTIIAICLAFCVALSASSIAFAQEQIPETMAPPPPGMLITDPDPAAQPADTTQQAPVPPPPVVPLAPDPARKPLDDFLAKIEGADKGQMSVVSGGTLQAEFPGYLFYALHFRMFPVAVATPAPLKPANVFALSPQGEVTHMPDMDSLKDFFRHNAPAAQRNDQAREVFKAWMNLAVEFKQDGFYEFSALAPVNVTSRSATADLTVTSQVTATRGGYGGYKATVTFGEDGKIRGTTIVDNIKAGVRPVCQATKLLDKDPIVRKIAEKDILVMGPAAKSYLDEQRTKAAPDLQREIDRVWNKIVQEGW
ncbi:MAG: hypothetical protein ACAH83_01950 [Alphaproteobacteria bacterium]